MRGHKRYSREEIIQYGQKFYDTYNRSPTIHTWRDYVKEQAEGGIKVCSTSGIIYRFKSWSNFLKQLGLEPSFGCCGKIWFEWQNFCENIARVLYRDETIIRQRGHKKTVGRPDIWIPAKRVYIDAMRSAYIVTQKIKQIKKYAQDGYRLEFWCIFPGEEINYPNLKYRYAKDLYNLLREGGFNRLARECKQFLEINDELRERLGFYTRKHLMFLLQKLAKELKKTPSMPDMDGAPNYPSTRPFIEAFGLWSKAIEAANLKPIYKKHNKKELISYLLKLHQKLKRLPLCVDWKNERRKTQEYFPSIRPVIRNFGNWCAFLSAAGLDTREYLLSLERLKRKSVLRTLQKRKIKIYSKKEIIESLEKLAKKLDRTPMCNDIDNEPTLPDSTTIRKKFGGSVNNAFKIIGLTLNREIWTEGK